MGGLQGALSRAARRKHKTRARPPASSQMAPSGFCPRPSWDGSVSQDRAWASGTGAGPRGHHSSPRPQAISPLCPCSGLRAWHPLQRRVRPVCAVHPGDLPGRGRPAQLRTVPQRRRARPGRCPQRLGVRRQVWAPPGGEAGAGTRCLQSPPRLPKARAPRDFVELLTLPRAGRNLPQLRTQRALQTRSCPGARVPHSCACSLGRTSQCTRPRSLTGQLRLVTGARRASWVTTPVAFRGPPTAWKSFVECAVHLGQNYATQGTLQFSLQIV